MGRMNDKVALITGAVFGLDAAQTQALARRAPMWSSLPWPTRTAGASRTRARQRRERALHPPRPCSRAGLDRGHREDDRGIGG
jgi:hypothetical protein